MRATSKYNSAVRPPIHTANWCLSHHRRPPQFWGSPPLTDALTAELLFRREDVFKTGNRGSAIPRPIVARRRIY